MIGGLNQTSGWFAEFGVSNGRWRVLCHSYVRIVALAARARLILIKILENN